MNGIIEELTEAWNSVEGIRHIRRMTDKRKKSLNARLADGHFKDNWREGIEIISKLSFCLGDNNRGWTADIDWFLRPDTLTYILEGKYDSRVEQVESKKFAGIRAFIFGKKN